MSSQVELEETSQRIAPFAGAIAKVDFTTKTGYAAYINSKLLMATVCHLELKSLIKKMKL